MRTNIVLTSLLLLSAMAPRAPAARSAVPQKREYLSDAEADKIRDAGETGPRIKLYAIFAADRIKKLQYEFAHMSSDDKKRTDRLNSLINGYTDCLDDASDLLEIGVDKQDIREGVKELQARIKNILPYLQELAEKGPERETYKENLDDAIEATQDAEMDVEKAAKEMAPPPVRRKPS